MGLFVRSVGLILGLRGVIRDGEEGVGFECFGGDLVELCGSLKLLLAEGEGALWDDILLGCGVKVVLIAWGVKCGGFECLDVTVFCLHATSGTLGGGGVGEVGF